MTALTGGNYIGRNPSSEGKQTFRAVDPVTGVDLEPAFFNATADEVDRAMEAAAAAFAVYRKLPAERIASFLERIAEEILSLGDDLIQRAKSETALPVARLSGERARTVGQLKMFAEVIREGSWVDARIDRALPDRQPPRPDLRRMLIPMGPVVVFGASNFPFAFSVAGGDTASALAAGNPVVVKAHPAHPGTSEMTARAVLGAAEALGIPDGVFSMVHGGPAIGTALVQHPRAEAVGFTGSLRAGRALFNAAAARERPIPVFAEMGSVNPVFLLPGALRERESQLAEGLKSSATLGVGQFCTNPGLVLGVAAPDLYRFIDDASRLMDAVQPGTMLYGGLCEAYRAGVDRLSRMQGVKLEGQSREAGRESMAQASAALFSASAETLLGSPELAEELFGPSTLVVTCQSAAEMEAVARRLEGQLTATVHGTMEDLRQFRGLLDILETKAGRLIINGFPTGVEVSPAMQHGGPYPATTDVRSTSVGTAAIERFARPICYQDWPAELLPDELRDENPRHLLRLVNGVSTRDGAA